MECPFCHGTNFRKLWFGRGYQCLTMGCGFVFKPIKFPKPKKK